jgi:flavin reductase (DIM6/NTAB) family NADH-FMN oxidoreductase RutF
LAPSERETASEQETLVAFDSLVQRRIMGRFAAGITVATTRVGNDLYAMTANAVCSLSLDPPLVLLCVDRRAQFLAALKEGRCYALNILAEDHEHLSRRFAQKGPKDFSDLKTKTAVTGSPILEEALGWLDCKIVDVLPGGDHEIFLGEILAGDCRDGRPLLYFGGNYAKIAP